MCSKRRGEPGVGRKPIQGKTAEHVPGSILKKGKQRNTVLEILSKEKGNGREGVGLTTLRTLSITNRQKQCTFP